MFIRFDTLKYLNIIIFLLIFVESYSQFINLENFDEKKFRFGYYLGFNDTKNKVTYKNTNGGKLNINQKKGINVGLIGELKLEKNFFLSFEPGFHASKKDILFSEIKDSDIDDNIWLIKSNKIHIPVFIKYSSKRLNNLRPYIKAGISPDINLNKITGDLSKYGLENFKFKKFNISYELALGIDFYLRYFKFSPSIRGVFGLNNEIPKNTPENQLTKNIDKLLNRAVYINFSFY